MSVVFVLLGALLPVCLSKTASARFFNEGINGTVTFTQQRSNAPVTVTVDLVGLDAQAGGYHVHDFPVNFGGSGFIANSALAGCGSTITGGHFNPLLVQGGAGGSIGPYECDELNPAGCEAGDISGKFGRLDGEDEVSREFVDENTGLSLFGDDSIVGRSVVIHKSDEAGSRWACASIEENDVTYKKIVATFDSSPKGVLGTVSFIQNIDDADADTIALVNLFLGPENEVEEDSFLLELSAHSIFNGAASTFAEKCGVDSIGESNEFAEEVTLTLRRGERVKKIITLSEGVFPLSGDSFAPGAVVLRSGSAVDCANMGKTGIANFGSDGAVQGEVQFYQVSASDPVRINVDFLGLQGKANGFHVHDLPVRDDCGSTLGHFNPLLAAGGNGAAGEYLCSPANPTGCEAGDLSNRFGGLLGLQSAGYSFLDRLEVGLTLFGDNSIIGRSAVVHAAEDGSRIACADILEEGQLLGVEIEFTESNTLPLSGTVSIIQRSVDADAETSIFVRIESADESEEHMYHVHSEPLTGTDCASTAGHFNPQSINGGASFTGLPYACTNSTHEFCEVGDLSGKHGLINIPASLVLTDDKLPLSGPGSITERSVTVHAANGAGDRIDCASMKDLEFEVPDFTVNEEDVDPIDDGSDGPSDGSSGDDSGEMSTGARVGLIVMAVALFALALYAFELKTQLSVRNQQLVAVVTKQTHNPLAEEEIK